MFNAQQIVQRRSSALRLQFTNFMNAVPPSFPHSWQQIAILYLFSFDYIKFDYWLIYDIDDILPIQS